jgi:ribosome biogenesis GTPase
LSKTDLLSSEEINTKITQIKEIAPDLIVHGFSSKNGTGLGKIKEYLKPAHTYCLLGSSGVGKTTLLNHLIGKELFETASVRQKDSKGRHTTTNRLLIQLENGAMIIDSPGMRELGVFAVVEALNKGGLDPDRYQNFIKMKKESSFYEMSYLEKKKKDKQFGKMVKSAMKIKKRL